MKIFIAHSLGLDCACKYVSELEISGNEVYFPKRDTPQDTSASEVLKANLRGIKWCDEVHVLWDGSSYGTIFDLGSAYALGKPIKVIYMPKRTWFTYLKDNLGGYLT